MLALKILEGRKTRKMLTMHGALHPKSDIDKVYLTQRQGGGRGLVSCKMGVKAEENNPAWYSMWRIQMRD